MRATLRAKWKTFAAGAALSAGAGYVCHDLLLAGSANAGPIGWQVFIGGLLLTAAVGFWQAGKTLGRKSVLLSRELKGTASNLADALATERVFFEDTCTANCLVDAASLRFLRVNQRMSDLFGHGAEDLLRLTVLDVTHADDQAHALDIARRAEAGETPGQTQFERRFVRRDGQVLWCLVTTRGYRSTLTGRLIHASAILDISDRKRQEEQRDELVRELAHRVRNTVQLTSSLARQTALTAKSVQDCEEKFQKRLTALKIAQDALLESDWTTARLDQIATRTLAPFGIGTERDAQRRLCMPAVHLAPQQAQTMALALHEMATNSAIHGALAHDGRLQVTAAVEHAESHPLIRLRWVEECPHVMRRPRRTGFGLRMLEQGLPRQFGGSATVAWNRHGLSYEALLPLAFPGKEPLTSPGPLSTAADTAPGPGGGFSPWIEHRQQMAIAEVRHDPGID